MNERKRPGKLLKVMSILFLVFGGLGLLSGLFSLFTTMSAGSSMNEIYIRAGIDPKYVLVSVVFSVVSSLVFMAAGIVGLLYKSRQSVLIAGVIYLILVLFNIIINLLLMKSFSPLRLISLIFPVLYLWGWYQSE